MIFDETVCQLGEGPLWHPLRKQLFWFDILSHRLHTKGQFWQFDSYVSAAGWVDHDTLLIASDTELFAFNIASGARRSICPLEADNPVTRSNDGRADPFGGFWIGTMGIDAEPHAGAIYRYYKGELREIRAEVTISNSICFAPDKSCAYYTDTPTQKIMRQPLDAEGWPTSDLQLFLDLSDTDFRPDGSVVDSSGNLFSAQWGASRIAVYDPNGNFVESFDVGGQQSSCPALGGPGYSTLFCTTAAVGLSGPNEGKTFATETNYTGQEEHQVIL